MNYNFHINEFEGPLDLLLHLINQKQMDIYEINISTIIDEYIDFINRLEKNNIDIASEYLVMSAELIHIKSKKLIHKEFKDYIIRFACNCSTCFISWA